MQLDKKSMLELAELISTAVVNALEQRGIVGAIGNNSGGNCGSGKVKIADKSAYAKTEALLYNYREFKRLLKEKEDEINELRMYGVPQKCGAISGDRVQGGPVQQGIVLPEESVEIAVHNVQRSVQDIVQVINVIDKSMKLLCNDPYYDILEMQYFEGRTQEDIALEFKCGQATISRNRSRLVKELALRIFPNQVISEMLS